MKYLLLTGLLFTSSHALSATLDEAISHYEYMQDEKAMSILKGINTAASAAYQSKILMEQDLDEAEDFIEEAIKTFPDAAELHYLRGRVMGKQAGNAFFSALSYAEKSQQSFAKAVEMAPENVKYNTGLMMFHLNAPAIAGGDIEIAKAQAEKIYQLDREQGLLAQFRLIRVGEDKDKQEQLVRLVNANPDVAILQFELAQWFQREEAYQETFPRYELALKNLSADDAAQRCAIWYQYGKTAGMADQNHQQGINHLDSYLEHCNITRGMPNKEWASFRRANIVEHQNKPEAVSVYRSLKNTTDEDLKKALKKKRL